MARFCLSPRCSEVVDARDSYCDAHRQPVKPWRGSHSEAKGWAWTRMRARILKRDLYTCVKCKKPATTVDAIIPSAEGGSHSDPDNLQSLCKWHAKEKDAADRKRGIERGKAK